MQNWVKVFEAKEEYKAEIVKDVLADIGCEPVVVNKKDTAYNIFGEYEVYVAPEHTVSAKRMIENDIKFE